MDDEYYVILSKVRLDRAKELLVESKRLLSGESYKSANNRAFYAMEKAVRALLALKHSEPLTHKGVIKQFQFLYVYQGNGYFTTEDHRIVLDAEHIRTVSDYDDFYIASKSETMQQIENAEYMIQKVEKYLERLDADEEAN